MAISANRPYFSALFDPALQSNIDELVEHVGPLPPDYVSWLRAHDGGSLDQSTWYMFPEAWNDRFLGFSDFPPLIETVSSVVEVIADGAVFSGFNNRFELRMPKGVFSIGSYTGEQVVMSCRPESYGSVWDWLHDWEADEDDSRPYWDNMRRMADSFTGLLIRGVRTSPASFDADRIKHIRSTDPVVLSDELLVTDGEHYLGDGVQVKIFRGGVAAGGSEYWYRDGLRHRIGLPAWNGGGGVANGGSEGWYVNGLPHRVGSPSGQTGGGIASGGGEEWNVDGLPHRLGAPARLGVRTMSFVRAEKGGGRTTTPVETEEWFVEGRRHRLDGPAIRREASELAEASVEWWRDDKRHREDGPAFVSGGRELWFRENRLHREDGPAVIEPDGTEEFWVDGVQVAPPG